MIADPLSILTEVSALTRTLLITLYLILCVVSKAEAVDLLKGAITSQIDNQPDQFAVAVSNSDKRSGLMFVYLHGAGGDFTEPFLKPEALPVSEALLMLHPDAILLSPNYGKQASWGNDGALADLDTVIRRVAKDHAIDRFVLIGNSMGASVALLYAAVAPPDIKQKLVGVVAAQPASDLTRLYKTTQQQALPPTIRAALGATPEERADLYERKSVAKALPSVSKNCRIAVITAKRDTVVPYLLQAEIVSLLESSGLAHKVFSLDGLHGCQTAMDFVHAVDFINENRQASAQRP
jgi:pimeloyl-ACP methyl ester carboxylesterase